MTTDAERRVDANPNRRFFVNMLVKDIELVPAIVDLVDNSVDSARSLRKGKSLKGLSIEISATADRFVIQDKCGGMEVDIARNYAFRFGRAEDFVGTESSVGQFGIGMKRALFKLGNHFTIVSVAAASGFTLSVNVLDWVAESDPDWTFTLEDVSHSGGHPKERGTEIEVSDLHAYVIEDFQKTNVIGSLRAQVAMKHQSALAAGLAITVNDRKLEAHEPQLLSSPSIKPIHEVVSVDVDDKKVDVEFVAGIAKKVSRADERKDDADASQFTDTGPAGWYIYCNERMVLAADKSMLTGWGSAGAAYHPQYRRFRGYVYMRAKDSSLLPWNTTKTGLDQDSKLFRQVQQEMFRLLQAVQAVINREKEERAASDTDPPITVALEAAKEVSVAKLPMSPIYVAPPSQPKKRRQPAKVVSVQYDAPRDDMDRVMEALGVTAARQAGLKTFEYFINAELE